MGRTADYIQLFSNMGWRYVSYRAGYEIKRRAGFLKRNFPVNPVQQTFIGLSEWRECSRPFFFESREDLSFDPTPSAGIKEAFTNILEGRIPFFSYHYYDLGTSYDWVTNPDSGFKYSADKHWTEIEDFSREAGDIKYVWEKSRFSFLYTVIRYDYHFGEDNSGFVFGQIEDWMNANPLNMGPNYKCSQEISLRILNWIFALYFYKNSTVLTEKLFQRILYYIYWQLHHVYHNIDFSRIAVRNNHAITETLTLYLVSTLFPSFPEASRWKKLGKKWFEEEIDYQVYEDGTFLQFSMNYHRVVIQLLTWAIRLSDLNGDRFRDSVYQKAYKSVDFLYQCQEESTGQLPNYGSNDGALFFKLSDNDYRDYRPQLDALHTLLTGSPLYGQAQEDSCWYGRGSGGHGFDPLVKKEGLMKFETGGYYLIRDKDSLTFIRCGNHKDRPAHADNLHMDIWYGAVNVLPDGGTYKYNAEECVVKYFAGTESHNTVMLGDMDQMRKGSRFIWYDWTQCIFADVREEEGFYEFRGMVSCFGYVSKNIRHERIVKKTKGLPHWEVTDIIHNKPSGYPVRQLWHTQQQSPLVFVSETDPVEDECFYSSYYGQKEMIKKYSFITGNERITTKILIGQ